MAAMTRLDCEGYTEPIFIWSECKGYLRLKASDGRNTWLGTLSEKRLEELAEESKLPVHEYVQQTVKALSSMEDPAFVYSAEQSGSGVLHLTWKKQLSSGVKFWLGSVDLEPCDTQTTNTFLLNFCADGLQNLFRKASRLEEERDRLVTERGDAIEMVQKCASLKDEIEKDLFGKFKLVLNEKKSKIRKLIELKDHLTDQNEEMKRLLWNSKGAVQPIESEPASTETNHCETEDAPVTSPASKPSKPVKTSMKSLLCDDASCRPPSPPPMKKPRTLKVVSEDKLALPHPPPLSSKTKCDAEEDPDACQNDSGDLSMDTNELLGMI